MSLMWSPDEPALLLADHDAKSPRRHKVSESPRDGGVAQALAIISAAFLGDHHSQGMVLPETIVGMMGNHNPQSLDAAYAQLRIDNRHVIDTHLRLLPTGWKMVVAISPAAWAGLRLNTMSGPGLNSARLEYLQPARSHQPPRR